MESLLAFENHVPPLPELLVSVQTCQEQEIPRSKLHPQEQVLDDYEASSSHHLFFCGLEVTDTTSPAWTSPVEAALGLRPTRRWQRKSQSISAHQHMVLCPPLLQALMNAELVSSTGVSGSKRSCWKMALCQKCHFSSISLPFSLNEKFPKEMKPMCYFNVIWNFLLLFF